MKKLAVCMKNLSMVADKAFQMAGGSLAAKVALRTSGTKGRLEGSFRDEFRAHETIVTEHFKEQLGSTKARVDMEIRRISETFDNLKMTEAEKADFMEESVKLQEEAIAAAYKKTLESAEQSLEAIRFISHELSFAGKSVKFKEKFTEEGYPEFILENVVDTFLTMPQHQIRANNAWFDALQKDFFTKEGIAGRAGKDTPEDVATAAKIMQGELLGDGSLIKYIRETEGLASREEAIDRILVSLMDRQNTDPGGNTVLNLIANSFKGFDDRFSDKMSTLNDKYAVDKQHVISQRPDRSLVAADIEGYKAFAMENFDRATFLGMGRRDLSKITPESKAKLDQRFETELEEHVHGIINDNTFTADGTLKSSEGIFNSKKIYIENKGVRAEYLRKYTDIVGGPLLSAISHRRRLLKKATFGTTTHNNGGRLLNDLRLYFDVSKDIRPDVANRVLFKTQSKIKDMQGLSSNQNPTAQNWSRGINNMLSTVTGASALRNVYDYGVHPAIVDTLLTGERAPLKNVINILAKSVGNTATLAKGTLGVAFGGKGNRTKKLADFYEDNGAYIKITRATMNRGFSDALEGAKHRTDASGMSRGFNKGSEWLNDTVNKISLADATNVAGRTMHTHQVSGMVFKLLDLDYKDVIKGNRILKEKLDRYGLGELEWDILKLSPNKMFEKRAIAKQLEFETKELDTVITDPKLRAALDKYIRGRNTELIMDPKPITDGMRIRTMRKVLGSTKNFINAGVDELATTPGVRGTTFEGASNSVVKTIYDMSIGKFLNITFSQWYQLYRSILTAIGLNPNFAGSFDLGVIKGLMTTPGFVRLMGGALVAQTGAGILYSWMKDLAAGDAPRNLDMQTVWDASMSNGFAGVWGAAFGNLTYGDTPFGTPATAFIRPVKNLGKSLFSDTEGATSRALMDTVKRGFGPADVWWARGIYQRGIKEEILGIGRGRGQKALRKKRGQGEGLWESVE